MIPGYRIIRELGRGGMATVYLAEQLSLGREVALKVLSPTLAADTDFAERFLREARITGAFRHRHLIAVLDAGRSGEHLYLAMEYVPGGTAAALRGAEPELIRRCLIEIARALAYAHQRGVIHRDIKPDNILQREDGSFLLSDFGIARSTQATRELTAPQSALGTPGYMSPEQWRGASIDGRADLYSLGIVAYELLTGSVPFTGTDSWSIGMQHMQHMQAPRPALPLTLVEWQPLLDRMLAIDPDGRYADAEAVVAALGGAVQDTPTTPLTPTGLISPTSSTTPVPITRHANRSRVIVAATLLVLAAIGLWAWKQRSEPTAATAEAPLPAAVMDDAALEKSVAVLPFRVLSAQAEDEFFADGLSEEILSSLASVAELKVAGRTSSFAWKGKDADLREIAKSLGVAHLLEGSIRRSGNQLRISANLINSDDGTTRWTQSFDRELKDAFAIQNEIALAVADQLSVSIGARPPPTFARLPDADRARYLEAIGRTRYYDTAQLLQARTTFSDLITTRNVGADAYQRLVIVLADLMRKRAIAFPEGIAEQRQAAAQLAERFPGSVETTLVNAVLALSRGDFDNQLQHFRDALQLFREVMQRAPNEAYAAVGAAHSARILFDFNNAEIYADRAIEIEPRDPIARFAKFVALQDSGRVDDTINALLSLGDEHPASGMRKQYLPLVLVGAGRIAEALQITHGCDPGATAVRSCRYLRHFALSTLGFTQAAATELQLLRVAMPAEAANIDLTASIHAGRPDAPIESTSRGELSQGAALEALAQGDQRLFLRWIEAGGVREWLVDTRDPRELTFDAIAIGILAVQSELLRAEQPELLSRRFAATATALAAVPDQHFPSLGQAAMVAAFQSGDHEAGMRRLKALDAISPMTWQDWVVSPSGRELPLAKILHADPSFATIWAHRAEVIERERAKVKQLWPDLE
jgi:serine/threonine protein kinase